MYYIDYAGSPVFYVFRNSKTHLYFGDYLCSSVIEAADPVIVSDERMRMTLSVLNSGVPQGFAEYRSLIGLTSEALLKHHCCRFHAVSFIYRGSAWLLSAPSGTGKTTQYLNWCASYPYEITVISGDMPVICRREDNSVTVHPSPWNGKEKYRSHLSAPLGGIILLSQSKENRISPVKPEDAIIPVFSQFIVTPQNEFQTNSLTGIIDAMLRNYPVWCLANDGSSASTNCSGKRYKVKPSTENNETEAYSFHCL